MQVVSLDWKWLFIYPEQGVASVNQLVVPVGRPLHFTLTSASVMNAFFVPQLGSMIYTMNGMTTQLHLQADQPGTFHGLSAQFSGDGFPDMHFEVRAGGARTQFAAWVEARAELGRRARPPELRCTRQAESERRPDDLPCRRSPPFPARSSPKQIPAAPGPQIGKPTPAVSPRTGGMTCLGKLTWDAIPLDQPIPLAASALVGLALLGVLAWVVARGPSSLSLAGVDHQRRPQAHRRHVYAARAASCCCAASPTRS